MEELTDTLLPAHLGRRYLAVFASAFRKNLELRFLYRDLVDLLSRYRVLAVQFKQVLGLDAKLIAEPCQGLVESGEMRASLGEIQTLAVNMTVIATYWLSFCFVRNPRGKMDG